MAGRNSAARWASAPTSECRSLTAASHPSLLGKSKARVAAKGDSSSLIQHQGAHRPQMAAILIQYPGAVLSPVISISQVEIIGVKPPKIAVAKL